MSVKDTIRKIQEMPYNGQAWTDDTETEYLPARDLKLLADIPYDIYDVSELKNNSVIFFNRFQVKADDLVKALNDTIPPAIHVSGCPVDGTPAHAIHSLDEEQMNAIGWFRSKVIIDGIPQKVETKTVDGMTYTTYADKL